MLSKDILEILKENKKLKSFLGDLRDFDVIIKQLNIDEIKRINFEYPNFLEVDLNNQENLSILCLTFIKRDNDINNYINMKKIKIYIDERKESILKILQN